MLRSVVIIGAVLCAIGAFAGPAGADSGCTSTGCSVGGFVPFPIFNDGFIGALVATNAQGAEGAAATQSPQQIANILLGASAAATPDGISYGAGGGASESHGAPAATAVATNGSATSSGIQSSGGFSSPTPFTQESHGVSSTSSGVAANASEQVSGTGLDGSAQVAANPQGIQVAANNSPVGVAATSGSDGTHATVSVLGQHVGF